MNKSSTHLSWHSHNSKFAGVGVQSFMSGEICLARTPCYLEMISVFGWDNLTENLWDFGNNNDGSRIKWGVLETTSQHFEILLTYKLLFIHPPALLNPSKLPAKWHWVCEDIKKKREKKSKKSQFYNHLHFLKDSSRMCSTLQWPESLLFQRWYYSRWEILPLKVSVKAFFRV